MVYGINYASFANVSEVGISLQISNLCILPATPFLILYNHDVIVNLLIL